MIKGCPTHWNCSWARHQYGIVNEGTNGDTGFNPQSRDNWQTRAQGSTSQQNPRHYEISQDQGFKVACSRCRHQQPEWCIEDSKDPKRNRGIRPGNPGTSPDYRHQRWRSKHDAKCRSYPDRKRDLQKHRWKYLSIIRGQCQKYLIDKIKSDPD